VSGAVSRDLTHQCLCSKRLRREPSTAKPAGQLVARVCVRRLLVFVMAAVPTLVEAKFDFEPSNRTELKLTKGTKYRIVSKVDDNW
jgi:hypothetical protein